MTYDSTSTGDDQIRSSGSGETKSSNGNLGINIVEPNPSQRDSNSFNEKNIDSLGNELNERNDATSHSRKSTPPSTPLPNINDNNIADEHHIATTSSSALNGENDAICYNQDLDNEIRSRLDKLNALSDLINSLERQFDEANSVFRETLKCSTDRLSSIAKALGHKSIRHARVYHAARLSVEQTQSDCQKACVQFEQANKDHQIAKKAIRDAELKLKEVAGKTANGVISIPNVNVNSISVNVLKLKLTEDSREEEDGHLSINKQLEGCSQKSSCDTETNSSIPIALDSKIQDETISNTSSVDQVSTSSIDVTDSSNSESSTAQVTDVIESNSQDNEKVGLSPSSIITYAAKLSEELNQAVVKLIEAETKRGQSERQHLERANKLMIAQENLMKLEREYGPSIRRSQLYFDESKRFNAKLDSVKRDICRISEEILAAKQAYAKTLSELEQFSDDLHDSSEVIVAKRRP